MTKQLILLFSCFLALISPNAAHAQAAKSEIFVKYYRFDDTAQKLSLDSEWKWENALRYANVSLQITTQSVLATSDLARVNRKTDLYEVIETDTEGNLAQRILLQGGAMTVIKYKRAFAYYHDTQKLIAALRNDLAKHMKTPKEKPEQPLMSILAVLPETGHPFVWRTDKEEDVMLIRSYLRDIPPYTESQLRALSTDFKGPGSFRIEMHTQKFPNMPMEISAEESSIRTGMVEAQTMNYYDNVRLLQELKTQYAAHKEGQKP